VFLFSVLLAIIGYRFRLTAEQRNSRNARAALLGIQLDEPVMHMMARARPVGLQGARPVGLQGARRVRPRVPVDTTSSSSDSDDACAQNKKKVKH